MRESRCLLVHFIVQRLVSKLANVLHVYWTGLIEVAFVLQIEKGVMRLTHYQTTLHFIVVLRTVSWTTDLEVARWFACESVNKDEGHVLKLVINKHNISAVIAGPESEYLVRVKRAIGATTLETTKQIRKVRKSHYRQRDWMKEYG